MTASPPDSPAYPPAESKRRLAAMRGALNTVMDRDRGRLLRRLKGLNNRLKSGRPVDQALEAVQRELVASAELKSWRKEHRPQPVYPLELPISAVKTQIAEAIRAHQVIVVAGETGSGKTTQLPKICLEAGRGVGAVIGHTQPRRIAARSLAERIAEELQSEIGGAVGYKMRFSDHTHPKTFVKVMTDGILLAETQGDPNLLAYDTLIIDEAHERSLNIDFLLGYLKNLLPKRPDLKLIITSATIDTARFSKHFNDAPVIEVLGRTYPVEMRYRPGDEGDEPQNLPQRVLAAVDELTGPGGGPDGDTLVFLSGEREIKEVAEALRKHHPPETEILPLFARLSAKDQHKVFAPGAKRRIVLATNVAETAITVPRIRYVIDPGSARISRYSTRAKVQRLPIEAVSQAAANQRAGRCGRLSDGICIRLYSEQDFITRPAFTEPEVRRTNLAAVILKMLALGLGEIDAFPFLDPPERKQISDGFTLLAELGAVDGWRQITPIGRKLAGFNVDPRLARMILAGQEHDSLAEILIIVAALSVPDPRERPMDEKAQADQSHARFKEPRSDFVGYLKLWRHLEDQGKHLSQNKFRKLCKSEFLSYLRIREWRDIHRELVTQVKQTGMRLNTQDASYEALHKGLLAGLLGHLAERRERREYTGARQVELLLFPGSALTKKPPRWLVAAELVETERLFARCCAQVEPEWVEAVAGERLKRNYTGPHWEADRGAVMAYERTALYGLTLCPKRKVDYGRIDPVVSREVFIRGALVAGALKTRARFYAHNQTVIEQVEMQVAKSRDRSAMVDEEALYRFYDARIPADVCNGRSLDRWLKPKRQSDPECLFLKKSDLLSDTDDGQAELFPEQWPIGALMLPVGYHFQLGAANDGVSVTIPLSSLNGIDPTPFEWLVPGMLEEKVGQLIKGLPKRWRKSFMPWPHYASRFVVHDNDRSKPLIPALTGFLQAQTGVQVPLEAWPSERLPAHFLMRFVVLDERGKTVAEGRNLTALQGAHGGAARDGFQKLAKGTYERKGLSGWNFGALAPVVALTGQSSGTGYPALLDEGDSVTLTLMDTERAALLQTRRGVMRLITLQAAARLKQFHKLAIPKNALLCFAPLGDVQALRADLAYAVLGELVYRRQRWPLRTEEAFDVCLAQVEGELLPLGAEAIRHASTALIAYQEVTMTLKAPRLRGDPAALADIREQLGRLIYPGFIGATPLDRLPHLARYLNGMIQRLKRLDQRPDGDLTRMAELMPLWRGCLDRLDGVHKEARQCGLIPATLVAFRFELEELRLSLFAQGIKTLHPVSVKRLNNAWQEMVT